MIPLFVYGTLRPGHRLYGMIEPVVAGSVAGCTDGKLYHVRSGSDAAPVYPVADFYTDGTIYGDVLWVDPGSEEYEYVNHMECSSGYKPVKVLVTCYDDEEDWQHSGYAYAYQYEYAPGDLIESGDWETLFLDSYAE